MTTLYGAQAKKELDDNCEHWFNIPLDEQERFNHTTCEAGEDTRRRMNVINKGGAFLWHCYNCNNSGYYRPRDFVSTIKGESSVVSITHSDVAIHSVYSMCSRRQRDFSTEARLWLAQYEMFDQDILDDFGIRSFGNSVVLPIWSKDSEIVGFQRRHFDSGPKYTTLALNKPVCSLITSSNTLFFVEDLLSAYKLNYVGASVVCLMGTSMRDGAHVAPHKTNILWLDSDLAGEAAATTLYRELSPIYPGLATMFDRQPKEIPMIELGELVRKYNEL
jgi:hypothetical protein